MPTFRIAVTSLALLALAACAGASNGPASGGRDRSVLTADEIGACPCSEGLLLDAIRNLRPHFLLAQGGEERGGTTQAVQVSINDGIPGPLSLLADTRAGTVAKVVRLTPMEVAQRFGMRDVFGSVLVVTLRR